MEYKPFTDEEYKDNLSFLNKFFKENTIKILTTFFQKNKPVFTVGELAKNTKLNYSLVNDIVKLLEDKNILSFVQHKTGDGAPPRRFYLNKSKNEILNDLKKIIIKLFRYSYL